MSISENLSPTLCTTHGGEPVVAVYGCDMGATRDMAVAFYKEESKTITNGTCPGHPNHVVIVTNDE